MATQQDHDKNDQDFAEAFNEDAVKKPEQTEDEAFGLAAAPDISKDGEGADTAAGADSATGAAAAADGAAGAEPADATAADAAAAKDKELQEREAALVAREQELDARAAANQTSNTNEVQSSSITDDGGKGEGEDAAGNAADDTDPRAALTEDFGPEFVTLMERFIKDVVKGSVSEHLSPVQALVDSVIEDLHNDRNVAHFKAIAAAHEDFMEIVESPEFKDWLAALPDAEQGDMARIVENGSSQEIIHMLTVFKKSKEPATNTVDESALDNAEGVRSDGGLRLPVEPHQSQDYAAAWNAA